jgi:hypothetical protein
MADVAYIGVGLYSVSQASRLTAIPTQRIRRWLRGYKFQRNGEQRSSPPIWELQLPAIDGKPVLGFLDLLELRFVDAFLQAGVSLQAVRRCADVAAELIGQDHPFSTRRFSTDGKRIFAEVAQEQDPKKALLDLKTQQLGIYDMIVPSLVAGIDFDSATGQATAWHPSSDTPLVVLDPLRQFGQPIIERVGIQTATLADAVRTEGSVKKVAHWFEL